MIDTSSLPFQHLVDAAPDGVIVCDQSSTIVLANAEAERMFGYERGELLAKPIDTLIPEGMRPRHAGHVRGYTGTPRLRPMGLGMELVGRKKDGSEIAIEISLSPIRTERGLLVTAGIRDVTERRRLERENRRVSNYLVSAVDAVQEAFALFDERDQLVMVNSTARQLFGNALAERSHGVTFEQLLDSALGSGVFDFSNETREVMRERWRAYHRNPAGTLDARTGTGRYLRVTSRRTADHGTVCTIADVTDDVEREAELRAASAAKTEFLSSMSHELRTPLNAILGFAQLLERDRKQPLSERQLERLHYVLRGGEHLLRLIDDVLDLSRIESGSIAVSLEAVDVRDVLDEVMVTLEPMAIRAHITLAREPVPADLPPVIVDRTRFAQILMNLGSNAIKYGKPGGHATFRTERHNGHVRVTVIDDGIGIPDDKRDRIFEPFQRAGQEAGPIEGTGIGLTISRRLAEMMRARMGFSSQIDKGSEFWLDVPIERGSPEQPARPAAFAASASPLASGDRRFKVVYIEDNPSNIAFMRDVMEELSGIELLTAPTAEIGLPLVREHRPAAVILDINLPGISGFEAIKRLREWPETRTIPVIGLSAAALAKDTARAEQAGFYRYLTKPVKVDELTAVLEQLLVEGVARRL